MSVDPLADLFHDLFLKEDRQCTLLYALNDAPQTSVASLQQEPSWRAELSYSQESPHYAAVSAQVKWFALSPRSLSASQICPTVVDWEQQWSLPQFPVRFDLGHLDKLFGLMWNGDFPDLFTNFRRNLFLWSHSHRVKDFFHNQWLHLVLLREVLLSVFLRKYTRHCKDLLHDVRNWLVVKLLSCALGKALLRTVYDFIEDSLSRSAAREDQLVWSSIRSESRSWRNVMILSGDLCPEVCTHSFLRKDLHYFHACLHRPRRRSHDVRDGHIDELFLRLPRSWCRCRA